MNIFNSGWRKRFLRNHSKTSSSDRRSPKKKKQKKIEFCIKASIITFYYASKGYGLASINARESSSKVDHSWQFGNTPFLGITGIGHFNKCYIQIISFTIDIFQFFQCSCRFLLIVFIWKGIF